MIKSESGKRNKSFVLFVQKLALIIVLLSGLDFQMAAQNDSIAKTATDTIGIHVNDSIATPSVRLIYRVTSSGAIQLRWAPDRSDAWILSNKYGYKLVRYAISQEKATKGQAVIKTLAYQIKPDSLDQWKDIIDKSDYAAIAAQALYGESFTTNAAAQGLEGLINQAKEQEMRFSFALFSADQSTDIARRMGLFYEDTDIDQKKMYAYFILPLVPKEKLLIDSAIIVIDPSLKTSLYKLSEFSVEFGDLTASLRWSHIVPDNPYSSFIIERSDDDGKTFQRVNKRPFVFASPAKEFDNYCFYLDSLPQNKKKYIYRVRGTSAFGETGPASDEVAGMGFHRLKQLPYISDVKILPDNKAWLRWEFSDSIQSEIKGFRLAIATSIDSSYRVCDTSLIAPDKRETTIILPSSSNYIMVRTYGLDDYEYISYPRLVQTPDSIPPVKPKGLKGYVDSTGVVWLSWKANTEPDLEGYRVYMSNSLHDEFTQITRKSVYGTSFNDTIALNTLTKKVYYRILAFDKRFNPSEFSDILELRRPDTISPASPIFNNFNITDSCMFLAWDPSPSSDVVTYHLLRRKADSASWHIIAAFDTIGGAPVSYCDNGLSPDTLYEYAIVALDDSHNQSSIVSTLSGKGIPRAIRPAINKIFTRIDRTQQNISIYWQYPYPRIYRYFLYRKVQNGEYIFYKTLSGTARSFIDSGLTVNTVYCYKIKAEFEDGSQSSISNEIEVKY
jgi:uncharacterized protein